MLDNSMVISAAKQAKNRSAETPTQDVTVYAYAAKGIPVVGDPVEQTCYYARTEAEGLPDSFVSDVTNGAVLIATYRNGEHIGGPVEV